jgi:hypothetical protein
MQYGVNPSAEENIESANEKLIPQDGMLPKSGWLASLLTNESLSICALCCEAVVAEAMAHMETQETAARKDKSKISIMNRPTASMKRADLLMFQSIAIHAITCVHELLLRRHAMDKRFQKESCRERIAALFTQSIFDKSMASVRWISRMESTHKIRSIWMLCFAYVLQEAPETLIREAIKVYSTPRDGHVQIHRFIRLLRLSSSTFQSFIDQERHCTFPEEIDKGISPWLLQESFNTICATTILVVEESVNPTSIVPNEQRTMIQGILDLLLHVLTTPQSSVTHLRAVGGAIQALEKYGTQMFLEITGAHLQHWIRVIVSLMNSTALSVRSIAVDFVVSLFGGVFELAGNIEDVTLIFATVLPEVAAREIALCSVSGLVHSFEDVEQALWPLRRSFADIEDANPLDDDRVDPQLVPILGLFCRASQAIIDGVLIEMRLKGDNCVVAGARIPPQKSEKYAFDADEESLFEAANFFLPETAPMQRLRWLMTLKRLHEFKGQWIEGAESLITAARTISDAIPHLNHVWRPSRFPLWSDSRRSMWLTTVGEEMGNPEQGNEQVMIFAGSFLEPDWLIHSDEKTGATSKLLQPSLQTMCSLLSSVSKDAVSMYALEGGVDGLAYMRLESLLKLVMAVLDSHEINYGKAGKEGGLNAILQRKRFVEEEACLRKVAASITGDMTKLAEKLLLIVQDNQNGRVESKSRRKKPTQDKSYYVRLVLSGTKPKRFQESTTLPTFLEWNTPCICRVPKDVVQQTLLSVPEGSSRLETAMCTRFCKSIRDSLLQDLDSNMVVFRVGGDVGKQGVHTLPTASATIVDIGFVHTNYSSTTPSSDDIPGVFESDKVFYSESRHFRCYKSSGGGDGGASNSNNPASSSPTSTTCFVEMTVAKPFPCPLSRQRSILTNEFVTSPRS